MTSPSRRLAFAAVAVVAVAALALAFFLRREIAARLFGGRSGPTAPPALSLMVVAVDRAAGRATVELAIAGPGGPVLEASVHVDGQVAAASGTPGRWRATIALPAGESGARDFEVHATLVGTGTGSGTGTAPDAVTARWRLAAGPSGVALAALDPGTPPLASDPRASGALPPGVVAGAPSSAPSSAPSPSLAVLPGDELVDHYTCPMHPSVHAADPGKCPLCGMTLLPVTKGDVRSGVVRVDPMRLPVLGVRLGVADRRLVHRHLRAVGRVEYDETRLHDVTLKYSGFVERLVADSTGKKVAKGDLLMTVYSPDVYAAELEYIEVAKAVGRDSPIALAARRKLALWDLSPRLLDEAVARGKPHDAIPVYSPAAGVVVDKSVVAGSPIAASTPLLRVGALDRVWVLADLYESELPPEVAPGLPVTISVRSLPGTVLAGKISYVYPYLSGGTRTLRLRVELENTDNLLRPDMFAHVEVAVPLGKRLVVAESAVVYAGERHLVFVDLGEGRMQPREVHLGIKVDGAWEILGGLAEGERVVESGNFLIASESRLKSALERW